MNQEFSQACLQDMRETYGEGPYNEFQVWQLERALDVAGVKSLSELDADAARRLMEGVRWSHENGYE